MMFKARVVEVSCVQTLMRTVTLLQKITRVCTMRLTQQKVYFILRETPASGATQVWVSIPREQLFSDYQLEGLSSDADEIYLEFGTDAFQRALRCAQRGLRLRLTRRAGACLTVDTELGRRRVTHDVPVTPLPERVWCELEEPLLGKFSASLVLPSTKTLKTVVDRLRSLAGHVTIAANQDGRLDVSIETELVAVKSSFTGLENVKWSDAVGSVDPSTQMSTNVDLDDREEFVSVKVDVKRVAQFLSAPLPHARLYVSIVSGRCLHLMLSSGGVDSSFQYIIPSLAT